MKRLALSIACLVAWGSLLAAPLPPTMSGRIQRIKALPTPLLVAGRTISVRALSAEREDLQWPISQFASNVAEQFGEVFLPLGSQESPLIINLGTSTNEVTTLSRRVFRLDDGYSQLVINVPNPETVDLEAFRVAIVEAQLRERARALKGAYTDFHWPQWFVQGMVNGSLGNRWQAEVYEKVYTSLREKTLPDVTSFFAGGEEPSPEVAAFFARWLIEVRCNAPAKEVRQAQCEEMIVAPWDVSLLQGRTQADFEAWIRGQELRIFLPGALLLSQFERWKLVLREPTSAEDARAISETISKWTVMRPAIFRDLCELYLRAYAAFANQQPEAYTTLRAEADAAARMLETHLKRTGYIEDAAPEE